ncbi:Sec-independent protein translocase subunit TatA [Kitasatospora sp. NPDC101447]|uniref:Sec-independent protein translocase subunit TatA n=1 Tax=Kitasatospora sp. NPDC101447 TaxID=3364102 RepID=UPI0038207FC5
MLRNGLEPWHVLVMVAVLVLLFGSKKLPEMARGLGKSMRILKSETAAMREESAPGGAPAEPPAGPAVQPPAAPAAPSPSGQSPAGQTPSAQSPAGPAAQPVKRPV